MEYVPYDFCFSVVSSLRDPTSLQDVFSNRTWRAAIANDNENRINFFVYYYNGFWNYAFRRRNSDQESVLTFEEIQKIDKKHLRVCVIQLLSCPATNIPTSFEEITTMVEYILPSMHLANLHLECFFGDDQIFKVSALFTDCSLYSITGLNVRQDIFFLTFLRSHLQADHLKSVSLTGRDEPMVDVAVIQYLLEKSFEYVRIDVGWAIKRELFEVLFEKPLTEKRSCLVARFFLTKEEMENFKKSALHSTSNDEIVWRKEDGEIRMEFFGDGFRKMTFEPDSCK